jgi:hypothetical protein
MTQLYERGSDLEVPGLEAIIEYGDASKYADGAIPGAMLINDHSKLDRVRLTQLDGLHDDPEASETRQPFADRYGEGVGAMLYRGRTIGLTGRVEAGNLGAMRDNWRRLRRQFGVSERDLLVHHPFEVPALINECINPELSVDAYGWGPATSTGGGTLGSLAGGVTDGIAKVGSLTLSGATGAGAMRIPASSAQIISAGSDLWITGRVKVNSSSGTVTSIGLEALQALSNSTTLPVVAALQTSPATGSWYTISARVPASSLSALAGGVAPQIVLNFSGAGTYNVHFHRVALVMIRPEDPTPKSYFSGAMPGFDFTGQPHRSRSIGPTHAQNMIADPQFKLFDPSTALLTKWTGQTSGLTVNQAPVLSLKYRGDVLPVAAYHKATKDNTTTSRAMGLIAYGPDDGRVPVVEGRRYRFSVWVNLLAKPATGSVMATVQWINAAGSIVLTHNSDPLPLGENGSDVAFVEQTAPAGAVAAWLTVGTLATTTANAVLELAVSDPCFIDVTDWDPGNFYGFGDATEEISTYRRIPRPFLLQGVRKTSDMKAPEQQTRSRAWRDFTMSLRASDPRIYCFDERSEWTQLSGTPQLVFQNMNAGLAAHTAITTPPPGFTAEGQTGTTGWHFGLQSSFDSRPMLSVGDTLDATATQPAASALQRAYRSLEAYTYTDPRVIIHGHFQMKWDSFVPLAFDRNASTFVTAYNTVGVIIKRVSSSQWLELRVNSSHHGALQAFFGSSINPPYTVELWSSHNASGSAAVTRLAQWDIGSGATDAVSNPAQYPMIIQAEIDTANNVNIDITGTSSTGVPFVSLSDRYSLPSGLQPLFGTTVSGQVGELVRSDNWSNSSAGWLPHVSAHGFPWISYFESTRSDVNPATMECQVIGDIETPQQIVLRGNIDSPILQLTSTNDDGSTTSTIRLEGVAQEANPVTVDVGKGTIKDSAGQNMYSMLSSGSLHEFKPGLNSLVVSARNWGSYPNHVQASWRDALS